MILKDKKKMTTYIDCTKEKKEKLKKETKFSFMLTISGNNVPTDSIPSNYDKVKLIFRGNKDNEYLYDLFEVTNGYSIYLFLGEAGDEFE
jgi:hypothetical protein